MFVDLPNVQPSPTKDPMVFSGLVVDAHVVVSNFIDPKPPFVFVIPKYSLPYAYVASVSVIFNSVP